MNANLIIVEPQGLEAMKILRTRFVDSKAYHPAKLFVKLLLKFRCHPGFKTGNISIFIKDFVHSYNPSLPFSSH